MIQNEIRNHIYIIPLREYYNLKNTHGSIVNIYMHTLIMSTRALGSPITILPKPIYMGFSPAFKNSANSSGGVHLLRY